MVAGDYRYFVATEYIAWVVMPFVLRDLGTSKLRRMAVDLDGFYGEMV